MADGATETGGPAGPGDGSVIACPHCGGPNPIHEASVDAIADCSHCNRSYVQPRAEAHGPLPPARTTLESTHTRSPTDVGLRVTGAVAVVLTAFFYLAIVQPLSDTYFGELFGARGWVPYVIAWLASWAGALLAAKTWLLSWQRKALDLDLLPDSIAARITPRNAGTFANHLRAVAAHELPDNRLSARSFLVERVERALDHFRMRGRASDVIDQLGNQSQLDASAVDSSYTMVRVFIWAIPLLGFIGTVLGISAAVAGFSDSVAEAVDLDVMKQSIGSVTTGLGVAFDTTLVALVVSIGIMFPTSSLQKAEEDFLDRVEAYCEERLGRRLDDGAGSGAGDAGGGDTSSALTALTALAEGATRSLGQLEAQVARLSGTLAELDGRISSGAERKPERDA